MGEKMSEVAACNEFVKTLLDHATRKASLYDGSDRDIPVDTCIRFCSEELGEVSGAVTRSRPILAMYECLDLAHAAFLAWLSIRKGLEDR